MRTAAPVILLITIVLFYPVIFLGKSAYPFDALTRHPPWQPQTSIHNSLITDVVNVFYTRHAAYRAGIESGEVPFWNPYSFSGTGFSPYFGSPFHYALFTALPISVAHDLLLILHVLLAGGCMFLYLRSLALEEYPSLLGAVAWMLNGYLAVWLQFEITIMMAMTLPLGLYALERWFHHRNVRSMLLLALALSLATTTGDAHLLIYQLLLTGLYTLFLFWRHDTTPIKQRVWQLGGPALALLVSLLAGALFYTHQLSLLAEGHRESHAFSDLYEQTGKVEPGQLVTLLYPDFYGSPTERFEHFSFMPRDAGSYPYNNYNELCLYAGIITLLMAALAIILGYGDRQVRFWTATALLVLLMAMGAVLYWPLATWVPGLGLSTPTRLLYLFGFSMCVLAAFGANRMLQREQDSTSAKRILMLPGMLVILGLSIALLMQSSGMQRAAMTAWPTTYGIPWESLAPRVAAHFNWPSASLLPALIMMAISSLCVVLLTLAPAARRPQLLGVCIGILAIDLLLFSWNYNPFTDRDSEYPVTPGIEFLQSQSEPYRVAMTTHFMHNSMLPFGIEDIGGYASFYPRRYGELIHASQFPDIQSADGASLGRWIRLTRFDSPLLALMNNRFILTPGNLRIEGPHIRQVYTGEMNIVENTQALPRAFIVHRAEFADTPAEAFDLTRQSSLQSLRERVVLESPAPIREVDNVSTQSHVSRIELTTNTISVEVQTNQPGYLFIATSHDDDWVASADGAAATVVPANYAFMAVPIEAGTREVVLTYAPRFQQIGAVISLLTWAALLIGLIITWRPHSAASRSATSSS